ncbi:EF-hand domain-containing protein [Sphingomonas sp. 1P06PA]|uniref:EF-hand domain-containing protein n=1 Tax=Sphingomonas sp. 1P06PA TaxID=554121 RepID=UPI0039A6F56E
MARNLGWVAAALLLVAAGFFWMRGPAEAGQGGMIPRPPALTDSDSPAPEPIAEPPRATEKTREEKRFSRYDKDKDGAIGREEYLTARRKAYAKLDTNGDGRLSFEEYAVKTTDKFAKADRDRSGTLTAAEFLTTRVVRKPGPRNCPPMVRQDAADD